MASRDWFGQVLMGKPILAAADNERQRTAFSELMEHGLVYMDTERGQVGYRSTYRGQYACALIKNSEKA